MSRHNERIPVAPIGERSPLTLVDLEPFVESPEQPCLRRPSDAFRFGYRCKQTGMPFATVEIPASTIAQCVRLKASVRVTTDGNVVARSEIPHDGAPGRSSEIFSLAQLIEETLHADNLRMEEAGPSELNSLLQQLEISMQQVKAALAAMHVRGLTASTSKSG